MAEKLPVLYVLCLWNNCRRVSCCSEYSCYRCSNEICNTH